MSDTPLNFAKTVYYFNRVSHQSYLKIISEQADINLCKLTNDSSRKEVESVMMKAHAYQIDSTRSAIPQKYWATEELLLKNPNLLLVSTSGAGFDTVDVEACSRAGVLVVNQTGANREAVAEHALGLILALSKRITETDRIIRKEKSIDREKFIGDEVAEKILGIVGIGNTGRTLAKMCSLALRMRVIACDPYVDRDTAKTYGAEKVNFEELLTLADYVSVNCPLNKETKNLFNAEAFKKMKREAYFVSTARGGIHDEEALFDALSEGKIKAAGLDVWLEEPPEIDHKLLTLDNVIATPHTAGLTHSARQRLGSWAAEQVIDVLNGEKPSRLVNPGAWKLFEKRYQSLFGNS